MATRTKKLTRQEAKRVAEQLGIDFHRDFYTLTPAQVDALLVVRKRQGYRKPVSASGSTGRYFFYYLKNAK